MKRILILLFFLLFSGMIISADDELETKSIDDTINKIEKKLLDLETLEKDEISTNNTKKKDGGVKRGGIKEYLQFIKNIIDEENRLDLSIAATFSGDEAFQGKPPDQNEIKDEIYAEEKRSEKLSRLEIGADITKGLYPRSLKFNVGTSTLFKNSGLLEEVTALKLSYHHYFSNWIKVYGFVERFSDSYLSLRHRYEVGGGIKFETELLGLARNAKSKYTEYDENKKKVRQLVKALSPNKKNKGNKNSKISNTEKDENNCIENKNEDKIKNVEDSLYCQLIKLKKEKRKITRIERAFKKRYSVMKLGFAVTFLSEMEKAEIETRLYEKRTDEENNDIVNIKEDSVKFQLDAEQRYRFVLIPSIQVIPVDSVTITGHFFCKFPLGTPTKINGVYDYRYHLQVQAQYDMDKNVSWAKKISVIFEYNRQYDNTPPQIPFPVVIKYIDDYRKANIPDLTADNLPVFKLGRDTANKAHDKFQWKLLINF